MGLNNETVTQESIVKFYCKVIPGLIFALAQPDENDRDNIQQTVNTIDITEPEGNIIDATTFITNCTEYDRVTTITILSAIYDRPTDNLTVQYRVLGLTAADTVQFMIDGVIYDTFGIALDGTYTQVTNGLSLVDGDYRVNVDLMTDGSTSQFLPLRIWEAPFILAISYEDSGSGGFYLTINYNQYYTDNASDLEIWKDGVLYDTISPVVNGENQEYSELATLPNGTYDFYLIDTLTGAESNHVELVVETPLP